MLQKADVVGTSAAIPSKSIGSKGPSAQMNGLSRSRVKLCTTDPECREHPAKSRFDTDPTLGILGPKYHGLTGFRPDGSLLRGHPLFRDLDSEAMVGQS